MTSEIPDRKDEKQTELLDYAAHDTEQLLGLLARTHVDYVRLTEERESLRTELTLRHKQLAEVKAMLRLPKTVPHEAVIRALWLIGEYDRRIDREAVPERYSTTYWAGKKVSSPYDPIIPEDAPEKT
jgi:hypothetical protein